MVVRWNTTEMGGVSEWVSRNDYCRQNGWKKDEGETKYLTLVRDQSKVEFVVFVLWIAKIDPLVRQITAASQPAFQ